jgi:hypothetical protein
MNTPSLTEIAKTLNDASRNYQFGSLQTIRGRLKGKQIRSRPPFDPRTVWDSEGFAYHYGGRTELQFNLGVENHRGEDQLRYGVAFSFETSRSLPNIDPLLPKVRLFNEFLRMDGDRYADLRMWYYRHATSLGPGRTREISADYMPAPIAHELAQPGVFVFLGQLQSRRNLDYDRILAVFDRLMPLYEYAESKGTVLSNACDRKKFEFRPGCRQRSGATVASRAQGELDVNLLHNRMQHALASHLVSKHGRENVGDEQAIGGRSIDLVVRCPTGYWFYEIKTHQSPRLCLREALGQLLEYAFWPGGQDATRLVVVGPSPLDPDSQQYLQTLQSRFSLPLDYEHLALDGK